MRQTTWIFGFVLLAASCGKQGSPTGILVEGKDNISANNRFADVRKLAQSVDSTLKLIIIWSRNVNEDGLASSWIFSYGTPNPPPTYYYFTATFDSVRMDSVSGGGLVGAAFITHAWMNSNAALEIAETNGGQGFRSANPGYAIGASLGEPVVPSPSTCWYLTYRSTMDPDKYLNVTIDATMGYVK